jgi:hypothetical protein
MMKLPEDRTAVELERCTLLNKLITEVCLHELRLATAMAYDAGVKETIKDYHEARYTTHADGGLRDVLYKLLGD